ncbi:MAG: hypothetical protein D6776_08220 [Planctomycetota bacterium]|nr:MAG: hypothetical protein D6776_08220 [Planctomycetota bacterium]
MRVVLGVLALAAGAVLGAFALLWLQGAGWIAVPTAGGPQVLTLRSGAAASGEEAEAGESEALERTLAERLEAPEREDFVPLAVVLEEALYERDWSWIEALAAVVRERGAGWAQALANAHADGQTEHAPPRAAADPAAASPLLAVRRLERRLERQRLALRDNAATELSGRTDAEAIARLGALLHAADPELQRDAAMLLARSGDERALERLLEAVRDPEPSVRRAVAHALAAYDWREGAQALRRVLETDPDRERRLEALEALAGYDAVVLGAPHPATEAIARALADPGDAELRAAACELLGRHADLERAARWREALLARLADDPVREVRLAAARALRKGIEAVGLGPGLQDAVVRALGATRDREVAALLLPLLLAGDPAEVSALLEQLAAGPVGRLVPERLDALRARLRARTGGR